MEKPFAGVYKWVGFLTFWGAVLWGVYSLTWWVIVSNQIINAALPF